MCLQLMYFEQTMSLGYIMLKLFYGYSMWSM